MADNPIFRRFRSQERRVLESEVAGSCRTLLDVGCGSHSPVILEESLLPDAADSHKSTPPHLSADLCKKNNEHDTN
ncbi:MAG: hypothetical protein KAU50_00975 [Candidatus Marinimicrobia bacterium]|nr:hypothetical protein [Candidatus Neomarinimicrobiota bacterium]